MAGVDSGSLVVGPGPVMPASDRAPIADANDDERRGGNAMVASIGAGTG